MKRVLVFGITDNPGGVESVIMNYYRNFDRKNIKLDFLCNTEVVAYEDEIKDLGGNIYRICARSKNYKKYKRDINAFFKNNAKKYDSIWVNICSLANIDYLKYAKKYGIKKRIVHCHNSSNMDSFLRGMLHRFNRLFIKRFATDFWSCSDEASSWFYSNSIIKGNSYLKVNNAIDVEKFKYNENIRKRKRKELNIEDKYVIGHIGRFHFQKNHEFLVDVFKELLKINNNSVLLLVGDGEDVEKIKNKVKALGLEDKVKFLGIRNDVSELLQAMDLFLFPSLFEGLSVCMLEAEAAGLPIITSETVSKETKMCNDVIFLKLSSPDKWALECNKFYGKIKERGNRKNTISKHGYSIKTESKKIEERL